MAGYFRQLGSNLERRLRFAALNEKDLVGFFRDGSALLASVRYQLSIEHRVRELRKKLNSHSLTQIEVFERHNIRFTPTALTTF